MRDAARRALRGWPEVRDDAHARLRCTLQKVSLEDVLHGTPISVAQMNALGSGFKCTKARTGRW